MTRSPGAVNDKTARVLPSANTLNLTSPSPPIPTAISVFVAPWATKFVTGVAFSKLEYFVVLL